MGGKLEDYITHILHMYCPCKHSFANSEGMCGIPVHIKSHKPDMSEPGQI